MDLFGLSVRGDYIALGRPDSIEAVFFIYKFSFVLYSPRRDHCTKTSRRRIL